MKKWKKLVENSKNNTSFRIATLIMLSFFSEYKSLIHHAVCKQRENFTCKMKEEIMMRLRKQMIIR